jgi:hypothetical protein
MSYELTDVITDKEVFDEVIDQLTISSMQSNYCDWVVEGGTKHADAAISRLFPTAWEKHKEYIWQWFDDEMKKVAGR